MKITFEKECPHRYKTISVENMSSMCFKGVTTLVIQQCLHCGFINRKSYDGVTLRKSDFLEMPTEPGVDVNFETPQILQAKDGDLKIAQNASYHVTKKLF